MIKKDKKIREIKISEKVSIKIGEEKSYLKINENEYEIEYRLLKINIFKTKIHEIKNKELTMCLDDLTCLLELHKIFGVNDYGKMFLINKADYSINEDECLIKELDIWVY